MATTQDVIAAPPDRVFEVLADPETYADWVVGSSEIRDADASWPAVGSRFHHSVGVWPLRVKDNTKVIAVDPPLRLKMHARARPLGTACVELVLETHPQGTHVTMRETAGDTLSLLAINPLTEWLVRLRNVESLRRLKRIAETGVVKA
ncbi:MAG TPA: SRPBCC family protein [Solirubrobacteraceae bacterium]